MCLYMQKSPDEKIMFFQMSIEEQHQRFEEITGQKCWWADVIKPVNKEAWLLADWDAINGTWKDS